MEPEKIENNPEEHKPRKVFIVVGQAGIGKSSFVRMLVNDEDAQEVKVGTDL